MFHYLLICLPATGRSTQFLSHLVPARTGAPKQTHQIANSELHLALARIEETVRGRKHQVPSWARRWVQSFASRSRHLARDEAGRPPSVHVRSFYSDCGLLRSVVGAACYKSNYLAENPLKLCLAACLTSGCRELV